MEMKMENTDSKADLLVDPAVVAVIRRTLRKLGVRRQDLEDGVAEVQTRALECLQGQERPVDVAGWQALCVTIAQNWRLNEKDKERRRAKHDEGPCEDPDERTPLHYGAPARDPIDTQRLLEVLAGLFRAGEMPEDGVDILDCVQAGMKYEEIGEELGISPEAVRGRLRRMRKKFLAKIALLGLAITLVLLALLAARPARVAGRGEITAPTQEVALPPPRMEPAGEAVGDAKALPQPAEDLSAPEGKTLHDVGQK
jgi:DNA-directed RNA polymerase specialized sigma24 family protein